MTVDLALLLAIALLAGAWYQERIYRQAVEFRERQCMAYGDELEERLAQPVPCIELTPEMAIYEQPELALVKGGRD